MKYFSLFTGIGGLDWGLEQGGHECVGFSEIRNSSIDIYKHHHPDHVNYGDMTKFDYDKIPDFDILTGGFPCQSFSLAGLARGFEDRRGKLIFYIYDLIKAKKPKWVVLENVKGLVIHDGGKTYESVFKLLMSAGYNVRVVLLNAANHGSAQCRERILFLCQRDKDFPIVKPEVTNNKTLFRDIRDKDPEHFVYVELTDRNLKKIDQQDFYSFCLVGGYDRVSTLTTSPSGGGGRNPSKQQKIVQEEDGRFRYLTELEAERLQGFPDDYTATGSRTARWFALGNAVNCNVSDYLFNQYLPKVWWN